MAGMERAKRQGRRVGRPPALHRPGLEQEWEVVRPLIEQGRISVLRLQGGWEWARRLCTDCASKAGGRLGPATGLTRSPSSRFFRRRAILMSGGW